MKARLWILALVVFGFVVGGIACKSGGGAPPPETPPMGNPPPLMDGGMGGGPMDGGMP